LATATYKRRSNVAPENGIGLPQPARSIANADWSVERKWVQGLKSSTQQT